MHNRQCCELNMGSILGQKGELNDSLCSAFELVAHAKYQTYIVMMWFTISDWCDCTCIISFFGPGDGHMFGSALITEYVVPQSQQAILILTILLIRIIHNFTWYVVPQSQLVVLILIALVI